MEDGQIIELYHRRDEAAIGETDKKYGGLCRSIAMNILSVREDAEECVSDTYHAAWRKMPPERPGSLRAFLGRITRNLSISRYRANHAQKRYDGLEIMLSELDDCVPSSQDIETQLDHSLLADAISRWLDSLPGEDRRLFIRRYWYGDSVQTLAREEGCPANRMAQRMLRLRRGLKTALEKEGITV